MLDMGFKPAVDRIVAQMPARSPDAVLLGDARGRDRQARRRLHPRPAPPRPRAEGRARTPRSSTASSTSTHERQGRRAGRASCATPSAAARSSSSAPSAAPTGWSSGSSRQKVQAVAMHGDKIQSQRERRSPSFERGDVDTLVATDVAARGIDVDDITHVINFDAPGDRDTYVHRIGRTGRAGASGIAASFVLADQHQRDAEDRRGPRPPPRVRRQPRQRGRRCAAALERQRAAPCKRQRQRAAPCQRQRPSALRREQAAPQAPQPLPVAHPSRATELAENQGCAGRAWNR